MVAACTVPYRWLIGEKKMHSGSTKHADARACQGKHTKIKGELDTIIENYGDAVGVYCVSAAFFLLRGSRYHR